MIRNAEPKELSKIAEILVFTLNDALVLEYHSGKTSRNSVLQNIWKIFSTGLAEKDILRPALRGRSRTGYRFTEIPDN